MSHHSFYTSSFSFCPSGWSLSIFLWVVTSFSSWALLSDQIQQPYSITRNIHLLNVFLFYLIGTRFVSHNVLQLTECTPSLSDSGFHFLQLVMVLSNYLPEIYVSVELLDLLSLYNHIVLVDVLTTHLLAWMHLQANWLADVMDILNHFLYLSGKVFRGLYHRKN